MGFGVWHGPGFTQSGVKPSVAGSADLAAPSGFAGEIMAKCADPGRAVRIRKHVGNLIRECAALLCHSCLRGTDLRGCAAQLPVRRPGAAVADGQGESAGPSGKAGELPAADNGIGQAVSIPGQELSFAERQLDDEVAVQLMSRVEVRDPALLVWVPRVDDVSTDAAPYAVPGLYPFGGGRKVDGLPVGVIDVKLHAVRHPLAQCYLQCVVVRISDRAPRVQRVELAIEIRVRAKDCCVVVE